MNNLSETFKFYGMMIHALAEDLKHYPQGRKERNGVLEEIANVGNKVIAQATLLDGKWNRQAEHVRDTEAANAILQNRFDAQREQLADCQAKLGCPVCASGDITTERRSISIALSQYFEWWHICDACGGEWQYDSENTAVDWKRPKAYDLDQAAANFAEIRSNNDEIESAIDRHIDDELPF